MDELYSSRNRLAGSSSLYLKQHSSNPVNWLPWTEKAFKEAKMLDRPVLLSIGYSTCHWCHVMEEENFTDPEVSSLMNSKYINIKVDREEMPAVDSLYMDAVQAMTGRGGWPLHVILDHEKRPFFGGTYFPKDYWISTLNQIASAWENDRQRIKTVSDTVSKLFEKQKSDINAALPDDPVNMFKKNLLQYYDPENPGFTWSGGGQKFPPTRVLSAILETSDADLMKTAEDILQAMADSGLHDRIGGGFHRYATDSRWRIPHFEKMLYDNAQLTGIYARAGALYGREDFIRTAESIAEYIKRDMRLIKEGKFAGYASAEDADDPLGEGSFYAWPPEEIRSLIQGEKGEKLIKYWDLSGDGNIEGPDFKPVSGWIAHPRGSEIYEKNPFSYSELESIKNKLLAARKLRPSPVRDDKVLTELNALLLEGFSLLARYTGKDIYFRDTEELACFLADSLDKHGVMRGDNIDPYITDYAFLITGFTAAYSVTGDPALIDAAEKAGRYAVEELYSGEGFFYSTAEKKKDVFIRRADSPDSQIPSGQNALLLGFSRLYLITGRKEWQDYSRAIIKYQSAQFSKKPAQFSTMIQALLIQESGYHAVLTGCPDDPEFKRIRKKLLSLTSADFPLILTFNTEDREWISLAGRKGLDKVQVLICSSSSCLSPVSDEESLVKLIESL